MPKRQNSRALPVASAETLQHQPTMKVNLFAVIYPFRLKEECDARQPDDYVAIAYPASSPPCNGIGVLLSWDQVYCRIGPSRQRSTSRARGCGGGGFSSGFLAPGHQRLQIVDPKST